MLLSDRIGTRYTAALPTASILKSKGPFLVWEETRYFFLLRETSQFLLLPLPTSLTVQVKHHGSIFNIRKGPYMIQIIYMIYTYVCTYSHVCVKYNT